MSPYKNLVYGQIQVGDLVMGRGTNIRIENFNVNPDDLNIQDYQRVRADEMNFGQDYLKPTTIEMDLTILENKLLPMFQGAIPNFWHNMPSIKNFVKEWRMDDKRTVWGEMIPMYHCNKDGEARAIFGRPGQFSASVPTKHDPHRTVTAEFRRADTLCYSVNETGLELTKNETPDFIIREDGDAPSWLRIVGEGPLTNPVITVGENKIKLNRTIAAGESFEISSYPWLRRAISNQRENFAADLAGTSPYLDRLRIPVDVPIPVRWTSDEINTWVPDLGNQDWSTDIQSLGYFNMPSTFTRIAGRAVVRLDVFNPNPFRKFIGAGTFSSTAAILYANEKFASREQHSEATIVEPFAGSSGIVIMSNPTMTNFLLLEVVSGFLGINNKLRFRTGSAYNNLSVPHQTWTNPAPFGWGETDRIAVDSHFNGSHMVYTASVNGSVKLTWEDATDIVSSAATNRSQGYIFDIDGDLLTTGTGFRNLLSYDKAVVPAPTGRVYLMWRDAWAEI